MYAEPGSRIREAIAAGNAELVTLQPHEIKPMLETLDEYRERLPGKLKTEPLITDEEAPAEDAVIPPADLKHGETYF